MAADGLHTKIRGGGLEYTAKYRGPISQNMYATKRVNQLYSTSEPEILNTQAGGGWLKIKIIFFSLSQKFKQFSFNIPHHMIYFYSLKIMLNNKSK